MGLGGRGGAPARSQGPDGRGEASVVGARGYLQGNPGQRQRLRGTGDRDRREGTREKMSRRGRVGRGGPKEKIAT